MLDLGAGGSDTVTDGEPAESNTTPPTYTGEIRRAFLTGEARREPHQFCDLENITRRVVMIVRKREGAQCPR